MRKTTIMALVLPLAACACGPKASPDKPVRSQRPTAPTVHKSVPIGQVKFSGETETQVVAMLWTRPGRWTKVATQAGSPRDVALVARDRAGVRMVTLTATGYAVNRVTLDCKAGRLGPIERREASKDNLPLDIAKRLPGDAPFVLPVEVQKICHADTRPGNEQVVVAAMGMRRVDKREAVNDQTKMGRIREMMRRNAASGAPVQQMNQAHAPAGQAPHPTPPKQN